MSDKLSGQNQNTSQGKGGKILLIVCIVVIAVLLVTIVLLVKGNDKEAPKRNVVVTKKNAEQVVDEMIHQEYIPQGYYSASMSTTWHFASGDAISEDAYVANVAENTNDVYFDIFLAENENEPIYQSPVLPRGSELENIALDQELSAGTYDCVMIYHLVDEEQNTISTLRVGFTIIIEQ